MFCTDISAAFQLYLQRRTVTDDNHTFLLSCMLAVMLAYILGSWVCGCCCRGRPPYWAQEATLLAAEERRQTRAFRRWLQEYCTATETQFEKLEQRLEELAASTRVDSARTSSQRGPLASIAEADEEGVAEMVSRGSRGSYYLRPR